MQDTGAIIHVEVVDKRETQLKSPNMERLALARGLQWLKGENCVEVKELTTDASRTIIAFMCMPFS